MRHNYLYIIALCSVLWGLVSCDDDRQEVQLPVDEASCIYLGAQVGPQVVTRTPYTPENGSNIPSSSTPLDVSVWASTTPNVFPNDGLNGSNNAEGKVAIHTRAHFLGGDPQLLGEAVYPKGNAPVYFVGMHPKSDSWSTDDNNTHALFTFSGCEDIMFAPMISGSYGIAFEDSPSFYFRHLLTYLRIEMVADMAEESKLKREEVSEAWGAIKEISIVSSNKIAIDLSSDQRGVVFDENTIEMPLYHKDTNNTFPATNDFYIPTSITEVAYVLCAPVEAQYKYIVDGEDVLKPEYTLQLKTEQRTIEIPIDLKLDSGTAESSYFTGSTMARQFTILLNFKMGNIISVSATIALDAESDWHTHGTGTEELGEEDLIEP